MMRLAMAFARQKGCRSIRSNVDRAAVGFYRKLGFSEVANEHSDGGVPMARDL
jgi:ribosomal protein S18 acetylase RimI-like enzyme